jgi:damage-control phosphatase, subfamily I
MKTALECMPCLLKQALYAARLSTSSSELQRKIMDNVAQILPDLDFSLSPPQNSTRVYSEIASLSQCMDPFADLKKESNELALSLSVEAKKAISLSNDQLLAAIIFSIAGNIIDYGSQQDFNTQKTIRNCLNQQLTINDYQFLKEDIKNANTILYLGDNSGEIVFDSLVIEHLDNDVIFAVKENPIINDALLQDAIECELDKKCRVISNGTSCPGTPLVDCSETFLEYFNKADVIISKGQGNFETLSEVNRPVYFLLTVKCTIVANHIMELSGKEVETGGMILMKKAATEPAILP